MKGAIHSVYSDRWISFCIVGLVTFVGDCARGILFPALWPLCQDLGIVYIFLEVKILFHFNEFSQEDRRLTTDILLLPFPLVGC